MRRLQPRQVMISLSVRRLVAPIVAAVALATACTTSGTPSAVITQVEAEIATTAPVVADALDSGDDAQPGDQATDDPGYFPLDESSPAQAEIELGQVTQTSEGSTTDADGRCSGPPVDPLGYMFATTGDFDGDELEDQVFVQRDGTDVAVRSDRTKLPPTDIAIVFGNGGSMRGQLDNVGQREIDDVRQVRTIVDVVRPDGLDRDTIILDEPTLGTRELQRLAIVKIDQCASEIIGWISTGVDAESDYGWCLAKGPEGVVTIRTYQTQTTKYQEAGAVDDRHLVWDRTELSEIWPLVPVTEPMCGPVLFPLVDLSGEEPYPGPLSGDRALTIHWINYWDAERRGTIRFIGIEPDRYRVVGRHSDDEGKWLKVLGTIEQVSARELRFEGMIEHMDFPGDGQGPCLRTGAHTFRASADRQFWRLQSQLSCNGRTTDYIDIFF